MLSGECVEEHGVEDPGAGGALGGVEELAEETLELLDWDGGGSEKFEAEDPGFFYLEGVDRHGEPDGVKNWATLIMLVGPWHLSGAASKPSWVMRSRRCWSV